MASDQALQDLAQHIDQHHKFIAGLIVAIGLQQNVNGEEIIVSDEILLGQIGLLKRHISDVEVDFLMATAKLPVIP